MFPRSQVVIVGAALVLVSGAYLSAARQDPASKAPTAAASGYDGQDQFATYCASCHGTSAKGDGPLGNVLKKKPADLTAIANRNGGTYDAALVAQIIDGRQPVKGHGGPDMPVWGDAFSKSREGSTPEAVKDRIDAIVKWLGRIQQKPASQ